MSAQKLLISTIDERITTLLTFVQKQAKRNPEVVFGDGVERSRDSPQLRAFCRELAADSIVLLKNKDNILPLRPPTQQKSLNIAVIGPNAKDRVISGGGSAALKATYVVTPWEGIKSAAPPGSTVRYHIGCYGMHIPNKIISCLIYHPQPTNIFPPWRISSRLPMINLAGSALFLIMTNMATFRNQSSPLYSMTQGSSSMISCPKA